MFDELPSERAINLTLKVGAVYKMTAPDLIDTDIPHYFVVIAVEDNDNYMLCSTTQYNKRVKYIKSRGWPTQTLSKIEPSEENCFTQDSFFDCNDYHTITKDSLVAKNKLGTLSYQGRISEKEYQIIVSGISYSFTNDLPPDFLIYEQK